MKHSNRSSVLSMFSIMLWQSDITFVKNEWYREWNGTGMILNTIGI